MYIFTHFYFAFFSPPRYTAAVRYEKPKRLEYT